MPKGVYPRTAAMRANISAAKKGIPSAFKGKKHTAQSKQNMSFSRIGVRLTPRQRAKRKRLKTEAWFKRNPEKVKAYDEKYLEKRARNNAQRRRTLRLAAIKKLGERCISKSCRWVNEDGSRGCTDIRVLQFDHVFGGGTKERNKTSVERVWKNVLEDEEGMYQLLCSNCNWIKAHENREFILKYTYEEVRS